jgi:hypothetical protein
VLPYQHGYGGALLLDIREDVLRVEITRLVDPGAKERAPLMAHGMSPDGRFLAAAHADERDNHWVVGNAILVWDLVAQTQVAHARVAGESWPTLFAFPEAGVVAVREGWRDREVFELSLSP